MAAFSAPADIGMRPSSTPTATLEAMPTVDLYHELSSEPRDYTLERLIPVDQTAPPPGIRVRSHVLAPAARRSSSPDYLAALRRRKSKKIATMIRDLGKHSGKREFAVWTQGVLEELRSLIRQLSDAEQFSEREYEGNSCEMLRQLRDTFLNSGWNSYRDERVRNCAVAILDHLAIANELGAADAERAMDQLLDLDLNPAVGLQLTHDESETEVSC